MLKYITATLFLLISICSYSQTTCDSLTLLKKRIYGFKPSEFSDSLKNIKSAELDTFWQVARTNPKEAAPCLQNLIENETKDSYFCFDASSLLLRLDTTDKYLQTVIEGINKCDLEDLQLTPYLQICFYLGHKGQEIGELAIKLISIPKAKVFLANHFITLNAIDASIFLFNTMSTESAEKILISAILNGNPTAKHNAAILLNYLATDNGDSLLNLMTAEKQLPDLTIEQIKKSRNNLVIKPKGTTSRSKILEALNDVPYNFEKEFYGFAGNEKLIGSACKRLTKQDVDKIRAARQKSTPGLSDEALHEYFALTSVLMTVRDKKE